MASQLVLSSRLPEMPGEGALGTELLVWTRPLIAPHSYSLVGAITRITRGWASGPASQWPKTGQAACPGPCCPARATTPHNGAQSLGWAGKRCPLPAARPLTRAPLCGCGCGQQVAARSHTRRPCRQPRERRRARQALAGWGAWVGGLGQGSAHTELGLQHEGAYSPSPGPAHSAWTACGEVAPTPPWAPSQCLATPGTQMPTPWPGQWLGLETQGWL